MKKAFITGISGQDGSYLAEYLLSLGYEVHGMVRRNSVAEHQESRIDHLVDKGVTSYYGDVTDTSCLENLLKKIQPDEIYNLAAQSHVRISFDIPIYTNLVNAQGAMNVLEAFKNNCPDAKLYQASSSEMFGNSVDEDNFQRESSPMEPVSPYGCAKLSAFNHVKHYRKAYGLHTCNGILFNHESPRRGSNFVTNKVIKSAVRIKLGLQDRLEMGNMDSFRDWGHSKDYVKAMHRILNNDMPLSDYVVATGETRSVRDLCKHVFDLLGMNYENFVTTNPKYMRADELKYLKGDSSRIRNILGWKPEYTFESMINEMVKHWLKIYGSEK
jgi:GDPmannose 4,6-dehydratase